MDNTGKVIPDGFSEPTAVPANAEQHARWQDSNRKWWQSQPMRYDFTTHIPHPEFSKAFYDEIDRRFFSDVQAYMPWREIPFDPLIDFDALRGQDVLEIGVGNGSHAALLAKHAKSFTGIDLTDYAVESTTRRLAAAGLQGRVLQMDAEKMSLPDRSFDFVWSWGVIHHSADTGQVLREIARVLRPGGRAVTMVYHRSAWQYYVCGGLIHGIARGQLFKHKSIHGAVQMATDGALARYYTPSEWRELAGQHLAVDEIRVYGSKQEIYPLPAGRMKRALSGATPNALTRFFTNTLGWGSFLVSKMSARG